MAARVGLLAVLFGSLVLAIALTLANPPPIAASFFGAFALASYASIAVHCAVARGLSRRLVATTLLLTIAAVAIARATAGSFSMVPGLRAIAIASGVGGLHTYAAAALSGSAGERRRARMSLAEALILPLAVVQVTFYLWLAIARNPIYDAMILAFERQTHLVVEPAIVFAYRWKVFSTPATICYLILPVAFAAVAALQQKAADRLRVLVSAIVAGAAGFLLYQICPSTGPRDSLGLTDISQLARVTILPAPIWTPGQVPRNAMPSLHAAWALLLVLNAASLRRAWRLGAAAFALLNIWAAVGRYQHWAMDIIVAVPLAAAVQLAVAPNQRPRALVSSGVCAVLTVAWLLAIRTGAAASWPVPASWALLAFTIGFPAWALTRSRRKPAGIL